VGTVPITPTRDMALPCIRILRVSGEWWLAPVHLIHGLKLVACLCISSPLVAGYL
jgi:hypothetical protein